MCGATNAQVKVRTGHTHQYIRLQTFPKCRREMRREADGKLSPSATLRGSRRTAPLACSCPAPDTLPRSIHLVEEIEVRPPKPVRLVVKAWAMKRRKAKSEES